MKRWIFFIAVICVAASLVGCDSVQRKFTRKKKDVKKVPMVVQAKKYEKKPSPELYSKHFSYWQSWQSELIQRLGDNHKKDSRCIEEILSQLNDMRNLLVQEKADELGKHIKELEEVRDVILREQLSQFNMSHNMMVLEREDRLIEKDFCVSKIRSFIKKSFDEEPAVQPQAETPTAAQPGSSQETAPAENKT